MDEKKPEVIVRKACENDCMALATIHMHCFKSNKMPSSALSWMQTKYHDAACRIWIAEVMDPEPVRAGYIIWEMRGGWDRPKPILELYQIGVHPSYRGCRVGSTLIEKTLGDIGAWVREVNRFAGDTAIINVWTGVDNIEANKLYKKYFTGIRGHHFEYGRPEHMYQGTITLPEKKTGE